MGESNLAFSICIVICLSLLLFAVFNSLATKAAVIIQVSAVSRKAAVCANNHCRNGLTRSYNNTLSSFMDAVTGNFFFPSFFLKLYGRGMAHGTGQKEAKWPDEGVKC